MGTDLSTASSTKQIIIMVQITSTTAKQTYSEDHSKYDNSKYDHSQYDHSKYDQHFDQSKEFFNAEIPIPSPGLPGVQGAPGKDGTPGEPGKSVVGPAGPKGERGPV